MRAQLSLEFLLLFSLSLSYLAFSFSLVEGMGDSLAGGVQRLGLRRMARQLSFASSSRGEFEFELFPAGAKAALWSGEGGTFLASCWRGRMVSVPLSFGAPAGHKPQSCDEVPGTGKINVRNYGVMEIESPALP